MKRVLYIILLVFTSTIVSSQDTIKWKRLTAGEHCIKFKKGETKPFTGVAYATYFFGKKKAFYPMEYGLVEGKVTFYYKNGNKETEEEFRNGDKNGKQIYYYKSGEKKSELEIKNNLLNGKGSNYYRSGAKSQDFEYLDGVLNGPSIDYYENGKVRRDMLLANGKRNGLTREYNEDGILMYSEFYINDLQEGQEVYYDEYGVIISNPVYKNGKQIAEHGTQPIGKEYQLYYPKSDFRLINSLNPQKQKTFTGRKKYELSYNERPTDSLTEYINHTSSGFISTLNDTSIIFIVKDETIRTKEKDTRPTTIFKEDSKWSGDSLFGLTQNIKINNLNNLTYLSRGKEVTRGIAMVGLGLSCWAILLSPLAGINKHGTYKTDKFLTIAGLGVAGLCITIPIEVLLQPKNYKITSKGAIKEKEYWYLETNGK